MSFLTELVPFLPLVEHLVNKIVGDDPIQVRAKRGAVREAIKSGAVHPFLGATMNDKEKQWFDKHKVQLSRAASMIRPENSLMKMQTGGTTQVSSSGTKNLRATLPGGVTRGMLPGPIYNTVGQGSPSGANSLGLQSSNQGEMTPTIAQTKQVADAAEQIAVNGSSFAPSTEGIRPAETYYSQDPKLVHNQSLIVPRASLYPTLQNEEPSQQTLLQSAVSTQPTSNSLTQEMVNDQLIQDANPLNPAPKEQIAAKREDFLSSRMPFSQSLLKNQVKDQRMEKSASNRESAINMRRKVGVDDDNEVDWSKDFDLSEFDPPRTTPMVPPSNTKFVGDDPLTSWTDSSGEKVYGVKIAGDAPAGLMSTEEEMEAKIAVSTGVLMGLIAMLLIKEQQVNTYYNTRPSDDPFNLRKDIRTAFNYVSSVWRRVETYSSNNLVGMAYQCIGDLYNNAIFGDDPTYRLVAIGTWTWTKAITVPLSKSVPLVGNITWTALQPLLNGASVTEFSSALRAKVRGFDVDIMANAMLNAQPNFTSNSGYSFCDKCCKALGYILNEFQYNRNEINEVYSGIYPGSWTTTDTYDYAAFGFFPYNKRLDDEDSPIATSAILNNMLWAVVSYTDFIDAILGRTGSDYADVFKPSNWGSRCAVVMIANEEFDYPEILAARTCLELDYPLLMPKKKTAKIYDTNDGNLRDTGSTLNFFTNAICGAIEGPIEAVLYVVYNLEKTLNGNGPLLLNGGGNRRLVETPSNPRVGRDYLNGIADWLVGGSTASVFQQELTRWERMYGNNSDRSSAMRWAADNSVAFGKQLFVDIEPVGLDNVVTGIRWVGPTKNQQVPPFYYTGDSRVSSDTQTFIKTVQTTPLGLLRNACNRLETGNRITKLTADVQYNIGRSDALIDFLVCRNWLKIMEEPAQTSLTDVARTTNAINDMAEVMASITDTVLQSNSCDWRWMLTPIDSYQVGIQQYLRLFLNNTIYPALSSASCYGIQFPAFMAQYTSQITNQRLHQEAIDFLYPNLTTGDPFFLIYYLPYARIPFDSKAKFHPFFDISDPFVGLKELNGRQTWCEDPYDGILATLYSCDIHRDNYSQSLISKISLAFAGDVSKGIDRPGLISKNTRVTKKLLGVCSNPDTWANIQIGYADILPVGAPNSFIAKPKGFLMPTVSIAEGGTSYDFILGSPREAFAAKSLDIKLFTNGSSVTSLLGATLMNDFDTQIYNGGNLAQTSLSKF